MRLRTIPLVLLLIGLAALVGFVVFQGRLPAGVTRHTLTVDGRERAYLLYTPPGYDPATPAPLVVSLHGFASGPVNQMEVSQWNEVADEHGFVVAYPEGTGFPKRWNTGALTGEEAVDDVAFLSELIDTVSQQYNVDPQRIYVNGLSNGGGMSNTLACLRPERIAAIGGVAGAYTEPAGGCNPDRPVPVIAFHGTNDRIVPYAGGAAGGPQNFVFPAVPDWAAAWAQRNGCDATPDSLPAQGEVSGVRYTACTDSAEVVFYTVEGGGHNWPGGGRLPEAIVGHMTEDIDASAVMWEFFVQHPLE
ncbi:MAG TPA: PHB depolymerase family esterase [Anaerolineae bacterium]|nr:PHB depolymerase family esterase [Anaerolineae bacterium]